MDANKITALEEASSEIKNFRECYKDNELYGSVEGPVDVFKLISFLIDNPHLQKIADNIDRLSKKVTL